MNHRVATESHWANSTFACIQGHYWRWLEWDSTSPFIYCQRMGLKFALALIILIPRLSQGYCSLILPCQRRISTSKTLAFNKSHLWSDFKLNNSDTGIAQSTCTLLHEFIILALIGLNQPLLLSFTLFLNTSFNEALQHRK